MGKMTSTTSSRFSGENAVYRGEANSTLRRPSESGIWPAIAWLRWAVWSASMLALVVAVAATSIQVHIDRGCKGGAFNSAFNPGFDIRRCAITIEHTPTGAKIAIPLPANRL
ncbi:MAG: hypothetical protein WB760_08110 [Xanthobacteraceae bacterium]